MLYTLHPQWFTESPINAVCIEEAKLEIDRMLAEGTNNLNTLFKGFIEVQENGVVVAIRAADGTWLKSEWIPTAQQQQTKELS